MFPQTTVLRAVLLLSLLIWAGCAVAMTVRELEWSPSTLVLSAWATLPYILVLAASKVCRKSVPIALAIWLTFALGIFGSYEYIHSLIVLRSPLNVVTLYHTPSIQCAVVL